MANLPLLLAIIHPAPVQAQLNAPVLTAYNLAKKNQQQEIKQMHEKHQKDDNHWRRKPK